MDATNVGQVVFIDPPSPSRGDLEAAWVEDPDVLGSRGAVLARQRDLVATWIIAQPEQHLDAFPIRQRTRETGVSYVFDGDPSGDTGRIQGRVTHYGESYNGQELGCGTGVYRSDDVGIVAVSPVQYSAWPCGTMLRVCGGDGCIDGSRQDACPGCERYQLDLSEAGITIVCGSEEVGTCPVTIEVIQ